MIENLIQNTAITFKKQRPSGKSPKLPFSGPYAVSAAGPAEEQNFSMVMEMISAAEVHEDDDNYQSPLDILFERLEMREPDSIACKQYRIFKQAAGKTAKSILVSVGVRLAAFNLPSIAKLTMTDELHLQELGERKIALFCCIPDSDKSLNYLVGMIYTQLIQTLYRQADRIHKGRLPVPVHCLMDEYANISLPKDTFLSALATMRSRAIFCSIIVQNMAQLKAMYKDDWESLVGLCDEFLYLGGTEKETHKYVSELLGKETISTTSYNQSKGRSGSYSINHQQSGRDLMTPDEVRLLDNSKCILFIRGERPVVDYKYNLLKHPNIRCTEDGGAAPYDYTAADNALDDLSGTPENYELLDMDDFLPAEAAEMKPTIQRIQSLTWRQFLSAMERKGYEVTWDASIVLRPPGKGALCSLQNAGQAVHTRSHRSASCITKLPPLCWSTNNPTWPSAQRQATPQVDDLQALYYRYLYELGALPHASHTAPAMPCGRMPTS